MKELGMPKPQETPEQQGAEVQDRLPRAARPRPGRPAAKKPNHFQEQALRDLRAGRTRHAVVIGCPKCSRPVLAGLDSEKAGIPTRCDPTPIDERGEAIALLAGLLTYDRVINELGKPQIAVRNVFHMQEPRRWPVLREHRC